MVSWRGRFLSAAEEALAVPVGELLGHPMGKLGQPSVACIWPTSVSQREVTHVSVPTRKRSE